MKASKILLCIALGMMLGAMLTYKARKAGAITVQAEQAVAARAVEIKTTDGIVLKGSYYAAAKAGPGVLLLHQINRTRKSWDGVAAQLAAAGINTLTVDTRGHGEKRRHAVGETA